MTAVGWPENNVEVDAGCVEGQVAAEQLDAPGAALALLAAASEGEAAGEAAAGGHAGEAKGGEGRRGAASHPQGPDNSHPSGRESGRSRRRRRGLGRGPSGRRRQRLKFRWMLRL